MYAVGLIGSGTLGRLSVREPGGLLEGLFLFSFLLP